MCNVIQLNCCFFIPCHLSFTAQYVTFQSFLKVLLLSCACFFALYWINTGLSYVILSLNDQFSIDQGRSSSKASNFICEVYEEICENTPFLCVCITLANSVDSTEKHGPFRICFGFLTFVFIKKLWKGTLPAAAQVGESKQRNKEQQVPQTGFGLSVSSKCVLVFVCVIRWQMEESVCCSTIKTSPSKHEKHVRRVWAQTHPFMLLIYQGYVVIRFQWCREVKAGLEIRAVCEVHCSEQQQMWPYSACFFISYLWMCSL